MRVCSREVLRWLGIAVFFTIAQPALAQSGTDTRPGIAVMPFANGGSIGPDREDLTGWEVGLQQQMLTELSYNPALRLVDRNHLREILDEVDLTRSGQVDLQTAVRIGKLVGARYMITPTFMDNFGTLWLGAKIINVETSEIFPRAEQVRGKREDVYDLVVDLSGRVTRSVRLPPLAASVQAERKARAIPPEAMTLYSKALVLQEDGETEEAIELYKMISQRFPQLTEAKEALRQLETI